MAVVVIGSCNTLGSGNLPSHSQPSACQVKLWLVSISHGKMMDVALYCLQ